MMNKNNHSISIRQGIRAAFFLALAFMMIQPARAQSEWVTSGNNINNTNTGNVGIGTLTPGGKLHIRGGYATTGLPIAGAGFYLNATGASPNAGQLVFGDGSGWKFHFGTVSAGNFVERMTLTDHGRVGIGTSNPLYPLDVAGAGNFQGPGAALAVRNATGWTQVIAQRSVGQAAFISTPAVPYDVNNPYWAMGLGGDGSAGWSLDSYDGQNLLTRMRVLPNGNVGIGTTAPSVKFHVREDIDANVLAQIENISTGTTAGALFRAKADIAMFNFMAHASTRTLSRFGVPLGGWTEILQVTGNGLILGTLGNGPLILGTNSANRVHIAGNGNVGIGTTAPATTLHVVGDVTLAGTGNITASGTVTAGNIVAKYQDIAEWVPSLKAMPAGTVVVLDTVQLHHVMASSQAYDTRVAGVISERPGLILGEGGEGKLMVATTGRVRVKVDATRAPIRAGDILVTSDREGIAMRSEPIEIGGAKIHRPGTIIGKALEPLDKGIGEILVLLSLQ